MSKLNAEYKIKDKNQIEEAKIEAFQNFCIQYFNQIKDKIDYELTTTTKEDNEEYILCSANLPVITKKIEPENIIYKEPIIENQETIEEILTDEEKEKEKEKETKS